MKKIGWAVEEMVAMVDLYYRDKNGEVDDFAEALMSFLGEI